VRPVAGVMFAGFTGGAIDTLVRRPRHALNNVATA